jgi:O-antigen/teichoic acid export membrane protein
LKLITGTAIAQAISLFLAPVITRLYSPADFGTFTFLISLAGGFGLIATLRYEMAIMLPKRDEVAVNVVYLSFLIAIALCVLVALGVLSFNFFMPPGEIITQTIHSGLYFIPIFILLIASGNIIQNWFNRKNDYRTLAWAKIINSGGNNIVTLALGFSGFGVFGLLLGNLSGLLLMSVLFVIGILANYKGLGQHFSFQEQKKLARKYLDLPLANTPQMLIELVQIYGIVFLLKTFYSPDVLGWYALSQRLLQAPLWLAGAALCQVYYKDASERFATDRDIRPLMKKTIKLSTLIVLPVLIIMVTIGPWLIGWVFGQAWRESGVIARILAPWFFFDFIRYSISQTPLIIGKTRQMLMVSMIGALFMVTAIAVGSIFFGSAIAGFVLLSVMLSCYSIGVIWWIFRSTKNVVPDGTI